MKKILLILALMLIVSFAFSQQRAMISKEMQNHAEKIDNFKNQTLDRFNSVQPLKAKSLLQEMIGTTYYDLQTIASTQKRFHVFDDGTMGAVWTMGFDDPSFPERGTGYNYFDGENWGPYPDTKLESNRSGWPAYAPYGENGEIVVSHISTSGSETGLTLLIRENKGMGTWEELNFLGPPECEEIIWPRVATGGIDHSVIHLLAVTSPTANCGFPYQGQELALLYSRSFDGGNTWDPENFVIPLIDSSYYLGFQGDVYDISAEGNVVGILIGSPYTDLLLLKSTDGGDSWTKTIIWEHPYPMWNPNYTQPTDTFYCVDGSHSLDFDNEGNVHVVFGINKAYSDGTSLFWFPAVGGIGYWNENRPTFSNHINALSPYGDPGTELVEDYSLVGWSQDINENGQLDILDDWGTYYLGFSSMPQIMYDDFSNMLVIVFSSVTETYDNGLQNYRHLWGRAAIDNGSYWGDFEQLTASLTTIIGEFIYPSLACNDGWNTLYLTYQRDAEPGLAIRGDEDPFTENHVMFMETDYEVGINKYIKPGSVLEVGQNQPNPFTGFTRIPVDLAESSDTRLELFDLAGKKVFEQFVSKAPAGQHILTLDAGDISRGIYFYTISAAGVEITKKLMVQ